MIDIKNIHSLSEFQRNTKAFMAKLRKSGQMHLLTVNGRPELVVQDAAAYREMAAALERAQIRAAIEQAEKEVERGDVTSLEDFAAEIRSKVRTRRRNKRRAA